MSIFIHFLKSKDDYLLLKRLIIILFKLHLTSSHTSTPDYSNALSEYIHPDQLDLQGMHDKYCYEIFFGPFI
jgi:hypothetical protein